MGLGLVPSFLRNQLHLVNLGQKLTKGTVKNILTMNKMFQLSQEKICIHIKVVLV